jgi:hypothetical protein
MAALAGVLLVPLCRMLSTMVAAELLTRFHLALAALVLAVHGASF